MPLTEANEGHRKEAKVPDKLTQKTAELSKHVQKFAPDVMLCSRARKVMHMIWSGDEQEKSNVPECLEKLQNSKHNGRRWLIR